MNIQVFCPRWGANHIAWPTFLKRVKQAGYDGIDWYPYGETDGTPYTEVLDLLDEFGLEQAITMNVRNAPANPNAYTSALQEQLFELANLGGRHPLFITAQTGREFYTPDQIDACLAACQTVRDRTGVPIYQETHRNKWAYAAHVTAPVLQRHPDLPITLDISHWFCVSESYLTDQPDAVNEAIRHTRHIHARVGHTQGPQVWDPAADEYAEALAAHLYVWDNYVALRKQQGAETLTITPEFGPPPYMVKGHKPKPDYEQQFAINGWMKNFLTNRYSH